MKYAKNTFPIEPHQTKRKKDVDCVGVVYSGEYDACDVTHKHQDVDYFASLNITWSQQF
jgi:hypothetical protein